MRILVHDYAGHPFQVQLSRELARRGHTVTHAYAGGLLTPRGELARRIDDPTGFRVEEVPMSPHYRANKYSFLKRRGYELGYGRELVALLHRLQPEVVISGNTPTEPQWMMIKAARAAGIPVVSWVQDFYSVAVDKLARKKLPLLGALVGAWYRRLDVRCFRSSAAIIAITKDFGPILTDFGVAAEKISVIPNWAPLEELPVLPKNNPWADRHDLADKFVFLYSGTLAMKHNPDLLRQVCLAFKDDPAVRVVVISEGPGADFLQARKQAEQLTNLCLLPYQPFAELPAVLASADVLLTALERDAGIFSVPSKVLTYHAAGRAILGAMPAENLATRILGEQGSGRCVEPDDAIGFVAAARSLREDQALRKVMGQRARTYAETAFDIRHIADRFESVLRQAAQSPST